ncbi:HEAT repeat domain-containing protein [Turneriella parva]|uniref:PBS lyase HEAT domain protein repeat-containing protein n=1 Tax=Turneriella parva (strain ATCC BAA-1111 / DSM 21527 / NCTC 11395 / H) TaxID=869212 RepID=I4BBN9_TURPD|nr:HEAT repeat domain-containing protein [Turneriella parva]AFM14696.1 PBS lyase HEAT domain protein repeat-containing protein [Turneriella parva DSM 21527]
MKFVLLFIVASLAASLSARSRHTYHANKAFEAGQDSEERQVHAIRECAVSRIHSCVYPIIEHLKKEGPEYTQLRRESANALGLLRAPEAREPLIALLAKDKDVLTKNAIIRSLGLIGNKADIKLISGYLGDSEAMLRRQAARALFEINDKAASAETAAKIAGEKDDYTRVEMINTALQHENGKVEHAIALSKILLSQDRAARLRAAEVMGHYANKETLTDLERAFDVETDAQVRQALHTAIQQTVYHN